MKMLYCFMLICAGSIFFNSVFVGCEEKNIFDKGSPEYQAEQVLNNTHRVTLPSLRDVFEAAMNNSHLKIRYGPNGRFDPTIPNKVLYFNARLAYQATEMSKLKAYKVKMLNVRDKKKERKKKIHLEITD
ncbi:uncharacterized protein LOC135840684 [Planococcus citri]|uniref:uncharacterized protein LOC135840684 n=1 Tax=Planococcus citri TaxID=170843 RepID=UPI0031F887C8